MQKNTATLHLLRLLAVILLTGTLFIGCENNKEKTIKKESIEIKKDSMPALDKDSFSTTRPETIKN
ncbi:MAG: hypothetical protein WKF59_19740 [Chitinophagaceae bacterium]